MAQNIRTLVALVSVPLLLSAGMANAGKPGSGTVPPSYDISYNLSGCEAPLTGLESAVKYMYGAYPTAKQTYIIDGLVSKVWGADQKTDQGKYPEAMGLLGQIEDKAFYLMSNDKLGLSAYGEIMKYVGTTGAANACVQQCIDSSCPAPAN